MSRSPLLNEKRIENYRRLRTAGFSVKEATKYKDRKQPIIDKLVEARIKASQIVSKMVQEAING